MNELVQTTHHRLLTNAQFQGLAAMPPELEWFANIASEQTRRNYKQDISEFSAFIGLQHPEEMRQITRAHVIAWRETLEKERGLADSTIRRKLSALSSLFDYLCECNAVPDNPVDGVKRPKANLHEGKTPALSRAQARMLLDAPAPDTLKGLRDRALLAVLLFHGLRRDEVARLQVRDRASRQGVPHFRVQGKGKKERFVAINPEAARCIAAYLDMAGHGEDLPGPLFRPIKNNATPAGTNKALSGRAICDVVKCYAKQTGLLAEIPDRLAPHAMRATAATTALDNGTDIKKVQEMCGHANISTTQLYDRRLSRPEDSASLALRY